MNHAIPLQRRYLPGLWRRSALAVAIPFGFVADAAWAQDPPLPEPADPGGIEEVVVTAQKREESLQDIPVAISAIGAAELADRGLTGLSSFQQGAVPALKVLPFAGSPTTLFVTMRGFAQANGGQITQESGVPIYVDDVFVSRPQATGVDMLELERVEVLRGPQGTLFGKNAAGGAVRFISRKPSGEFGVRQNAEMGNFGYWKADTHIDLPSVAGVATKIDFIVTENDGWIENRAADQEDFGRLESMGGRFSALWTPLDRLSLSYAGDYVDAKSTAAYNQNLFTNDPYNVWPATDGRLEETSYPLNRPLSPERVQSHTADVSWEANDGLTIRSITGYRKVDSLLYNTSAGTSAFPVPIPGLDYLSSPTVTYDVSYDQLSQELQFIGSTGNTEWVGGLYYFEDEGTQAEFTQFGVAFPGTVTNEFGIPTQLGTPIALDPLLSLGGVPTSNDVSNRSWAVFGQTTWKPGALEDRLALTLGARYGNDTKEATRNVGGIWDAPAYDGSPADQICPCAPSKSDENEFSPLAVISYGWTPDVSTYLRYSTGYRGSGVGLNSQTFNAVEADHVYSWESGIKADLFDRRARFNLAAFYQDWEDPQLNVQTVDSSTVEFFNGPDQVIKGIEVDLTVLPIDDLTISLSFAGYDGSRPSAANPYENPAVETDDFVIGNIVQLPARSGSISVIYDFLQTRLGNWQLNVDGNGSSDYATVPNANLLPGYWIWNGRLKLADIQWGSRGALDVALWGRNLADKEYRVFQYQVPGIAPGTFTEQGVYGTPRTYGLSLAYRF